MAERAPRNALRWLAGQGALHAAAVAFGFACFALLFRADLFSGLTILFYRGLVLLVLAFGIGLCVMAGLAGLLRAWGVRRRDALGACVLSLSLNLSFLVIFPVTVDRSISVFLLGRMAAHPGESFTADRARAEFEAVYLGRFRQIERRMAEQTVSGTIAPAGEGYVITPRGLAFIRLSGLVAWAFRTDARLIEGRASSDAALIAGAAEPR